jgi:cobalt-precorrin 5A hydrolase
MIVAGIGCRRLTPPEEIEAVIALALDRLDLDARALDGLATLAERAEEPGMREAARRLALPLIACSGEALQHVASRIVTRSERVEAAIGLPSVAEAAALFAAGPHACLRLPRIATRRATCAIAEARSP